MPISKKFIQRLIEMIIDGNKLSSVNQNLQMKGFTDMIDNLINILISYNQAELTVFNLDGLIAQYPDISQIYYQKYMIKDKNDEVTQSELTLVVLKFDQENREQNHYQSVKIQIDEEPIETRIEKLLAQKYTVQERITFIVNKQTGQVYDSKNQKIIDNLLKPIEVKAQKPNWQKYWKNVNYQHQKFIEASMKGDLNVLMSLFNKQKSQVPIDVNFKTFDDWTALHFAALNGRLECVDFLIKNKANLNQKTKFGWTPLHIAAKKNQYNTSLVLIQNGIEINAQDQDFCTALHYAAQNGYLQLVTVLLQRGANTKIRNCQGRTPKQCSQNIQTFNLFKQQQKQTYSKQIFGGVLLQNSRTDHIQRLLNRRVPIQQSKVEQKVPQKNQKQKDKQKLKNKKFVNIMKTYQAMSMKKNEPVSAKDFIFFKMIGKGSFGEVYLVRKIDEPQDQLLAMKVMSKEKIMGSSLSRYIKTQKDILSLISHPFIVRLHYSFQTQTKLFLVMQYCEGGDLSAALEKRRKFPEEVAKIYISEIILALQALHKNMIIYRDMKPENIVLDRDGHAMLTDFGLSKKGEIDKINSSFCGTPAYLAPQILEKKGHNRMADWYQLGIVLFELLVGLPPFYATTKQQLYKNKRQSILKIPKYLSQQCRDLIKKLLMKNPTERLGAEKDGQSIREHAWFKDIDWQKVYNRQLAPPKPDIKLKLGKPMAIKFHEGKPQKNQMSEWTFVS